MKKGGGVMRVDEVRNSFNSVLSRIHQIEERYDARQSELRRKAMEVEAVQSSTADVMEVKRRYESEIDRQRQQIEGFRSTLDHLVSHLQAMKKAKKKP
uniref:Uncharacterized protein n=1 Tax=Palpitomonas bilix TaxID=652834 RepID=A0A7S3GMJ2_9EUKA